MGPHKPQHGELAKRRGHKLRRFHSFYGDTCRIIFVAGDNQTYVQRMVFNGREFVAADLF